MNLPEDTHLAYIVSHEAWYAKTPGIVDRPSVSVQASAEGGGCAWEFAVEEVELGRRTSLKAYVFDDAFAAFAQIPEFFAALAESGDSATLSLVRKVLDDMGAADETKRENTATEGDHGVIQVVLTPASRKAFSAWLAGRGQHLYQIPGGEDDLPTFGVGVRE